MASDIARLRTRHITPRTSPGARWPAWAAGAEAVSWLREASETGFPAYTLFARDPLLDPIRTDAAFRGLMAEMEKKSMAMRRSLFPG